MKRFIKFSHVFYLILIGSLFLFTNFSYGMAVAEEAGAKAVSEAAEGAFGKGAVEGLEKGAMESAAREVAEKMGVSVEDIGLLPEEAKIQFKTELQSAFKEAGFENVFKESKFAGSTEFTNKITTAKGNFTKNLSSLGEERGFSDFEAKAVQKFNPEITAEKFPVKSTSEMNTFQVNKAAEFEPVEVELTPAEEDFMTAQRDLDSAMRDVEYATKNNPAKLEEAQAKLNDANENFLKKEQSYEDERATIEKNTVRASEEAEVLEEKVATDPNRGNKANARSKAQDAEDAADAAKGDKTKVERKSALKEYEEARATKKGNPEKTDKVKKQELKDANEKVRKTEQELEAAKNEKPPNPKKIKQLEQELKTAKGQQEVAKSEAGTKLRKDVAQEEVNAKVEGAQQELTDAAEADRVADEDFKAATQKLDESGQGSWGFWFKRRGLDTLNTFKEQLIMGIVGGFAFTIPNFVVAPIQSAMSAEAERNTLLKPQLFGGVWMQIPRDLISSAGEGVVAKYLYVAVPNAKTTDKSVERSDAGDAKSYFKNAPMYMSRTEYDDYASAPITGAQFPGEIVNLNTAFQFVGDGEGDYDWPVIPFIGEVPKGFRGTPLQPHLNKQEEEILRGISSEQYFEERYQETEYTGIPEIADQFNPDKNSQYKTDYPGLDKGYGSILNNSIQAFANGTQFGPFKVEAFSSLSNAAQKALGIQTPPEQKPWVALGQYLYQTADTPNIKSVRALLAKDPETADIADEVVEYVIMKSDTKGAGSSIRLQMPDAAGNPYGIVSYQLNPDIDSMLSLFDYAAYNNQGNASSSGLTAKNALADVAITDQGVVEQIAKMNQYISDKVKYGPFVVGGKSLTTQQDWVDAGVNVYKIAGALEDGSDDYVIATNGFTVSFLPGSPSNFISLVTSRVYDGELIPYDKKLGGRISIPYVVYKQTDETLPPLVITGSPNQKNGIPITTGLKAPLYSLFMDPDINPNQIPQANIEKQEDRAWYAKKAGVDVSEKNYPVIVPEQWALGDRGPVMPSEGKQTTQRIGDALQGQKDILALINTSYNEWKNYYKKLDPEAVERELGVFIFVPIEPRPITIRATSAADVKNGNFVYTSAFMPDEYLVLSDTPDATGAKFATEYDAAEPQRYAISLSSGNVYDAQANGEIIDTIDNLDQLMQKVTTKQPKFLSPLLKAIKGAQTIQVKNKQKDQYGPNTFFGPFRLYIQKEDLDAGQYVYADMTPFGNPLKMNEKELEGILNKANYYVAISLKEGTSDATDPKNWDYGKQLGPTETNPTKTMYVVSLITGILYDRGGGFSGYVKEFADAVDGNLDVQEGFLNLIFGYLQTTWGKGMRSDLKDRILKLTQAEYKKLLDEKAAISKAVQKEKALFAPLNAMTRSNLDNDKAAPYIELLQKMDPPRYVKKYNNKYYAVVPADPGPKIYIDYNVGDSTKDNELGMSYDADGNALVRLTGWVLENARAFAGIIVKPDGSQELAVAMDHPSIPMDGMVKLEEAAMEKKLTAARDAYQKALKAAGKKSTPELLKASAQLGFARQEHQAAQVAKAIIDDLKKAGRFAGYNFYYNEQIGSYFIGIPETGGDRYIDLVAGYQFNPDGSPRLFEQPVYYNQTTNDKEDLLFVSQEAYGLFIAVFKGNDKKYYEWSVYDEQREYNTETKTYDRNYFVSNEVVDTGNVIYKSKDKKYLVATTPIVTGQELKIGTYVSDSERKYSLLHYFRTQDAKGGGSYNKTDADAVDPTFIIWNGKPSLELKELYYKNNLIKLSGSGTSFTGQYTQDGQTRSITINKVVKDHGKLVKAHYLTITDGKTIYDFLYDTSILNPQLPVTCSTDLLTQETEIRNLNYWKQCPGGWNLNVVADVRGVNRLLMGMQAGNLKAAKISDAQKKQAGDRAPILTENIKLISYDSTTNQYFYKITADRDSKWAYYQPQWNGWYVDLSNGVLYSINPATSVGYYPIGSLQMSQFYLLLDRLEVSVAPVADSAGEPIFDSQGGPVMDPTTNKQIIGKPGLVYRSPTVIKDEKVLNQSIVDAAKEVQKQQAVGQ